MTKVPPVLEVLVPEARVHVEAELLLNGGDARRVAIPGLRGPGDSASDTCKAPSEEKSSFELRHCSTFTLSKV